MLAKVWNDDHRPYTEKFNEQDVTIASGKFVEMDYFDAVGFIGQFVKPQKLDDGTILNPKKLRLDVDFSQVATKHVEHRCQACKGLFATENELLMHSKLMHEEKVVMQEERPTKPAPELRTR